MKKNIKKNILQILLLLALTAFALWFALKDDYQEVLRNVTHVSWVWLCIIAALGILYYLIQGIILYMIAKPYKKDLKIWDGIHNAYIAAFFNGVTPLGGGQVAQTYAFRKLGFEYSDIASILWKDFLLFQSTVLFYVTILIITRFQFAIHEFQAYFLLVLLGFLINSSVIVILWTMSKFPKFYVKVSNVIVGLLHKFHIVKDKAYTLEKWQGQVEYFNEEIKKLKQDKMLIINAVILNFIRMTIFYALPYVVALALHIPMTPFDFINVILMSSFIHMLNALTPLPGDTGWTESAFIILFAIMFGRVEASSVMILWRMATYHINLLIGGGIFLHVKAKEKVKPTEKKSSIKLDNTIEEANIKHVKYES